MTGQPSVSGSRLQVNVLSNLSANIWLATITFLAIPVIYRSLGPSQYAIVGMYLLAIQWSAFLVVQVAVGSLETLWFRSRLLHALGSQRKPVPREDVRQQLQVGLSNAGLGVLWIVNIQVDKLVLSSTYN